jgi:hypothetical protein
MVHRSLAIAAAGSTRHATAKDMRRRQATRRESSTRARMRRVAVTPVSDDVQALSPGHRILRPLITKGDGMRQHWFAALVCAALWTAPAHAQIVFNVTTYAGNGEAIAVGDVNEDGFPDVLTGTRRTSQ